ncbi:MULTISPECIES: hypothetical protein [unclassified Pseudoalteromonas]|uniref:hypothetical protein n=1 Tax=unclassified Pseudoalteromonas TaxID=194690 RepID=UPI00209692D3|nr:hypothetical protein [Pseudoalteromonas sp. XMcav2-N]MCO7190427.1 hypothetical protein [Pseudoalteromonas sp. XMcav2-N]
MKIFAMIIAACLCVSSTVALADTAIHQHKSLEIKLQSQLPRVSLTVVRDQTDGLNLTIGIANYVLNSPAEAERKQQTLTGHAHLFINGEKKMRVYSQDVHLPASWFQEGVNQIAVSLNSHQHENWTWKGNTVMGSVFVNLAAPDLVLHQFSSQPLLSHHHH